MNILLLHPFYHSYWFHKLSSEDDPTFPVPHFVSTLARGFWAFFHRGDLELMFFLSFFSPTNHFTSLRCAVSIPLTGSLPVVS